MRTERENIDIVLTEFRLKRKKNEDAKKLYKIKF